MAELRFCPECKATLRKSAKGNTYCPNGAWMNKGGKCTWKGINQRYQKRPVVVKKPIPPLPTPSAQQSHIFKRFAAAICNFVIRALAGTGKTTVLVQLIRIAVENGRQVLCLAFARRDKASLEMRSFGNGKIGTSNGAGHWMLSDHLRRANGKSLDVQQGSTKNLLEKRWRDDGLIVKEGGEDVWKVRYDVFADIIFFVEKIRGCVPLRADGVEFPAMPTERNIQEIADRFDRELSQETLPQVVFYTLWLFSVVASLRQMEVTGVIDYASQVFLPVYHKLEPSQKFDDVLVDEGQDQNIYNRVLAFKYVAPGGRIVVVGDENQAIYEWRGADFDSMDQWAAAMGKYEQLPLTVCRRCSQVVIKDAQCLVPEIEALPDAPEGTRRIMPEVREMMAELEANRKGLILCRTNAPLVSCVLKLMALGLPATLLRTNLIGDLLRLIDQLSERDDNCDIPKLLGALNLWASEKLARIAKQRNADGKAQIIEDKVGVITAFGEITSIRNAGELKRKIDEVFPALKDDERPDPAKMIVGSTIHGIKGGEAPDVYIFSPTKGYKISLFDQVWGSARERDNTLYVAITRAQENITYVGHMPTLARLNQGDDAGDELGEMTDDE